MTFHVDITATDYAATFRNAGGAICGTDTGPLALLQGVCERVQADPNILSATYTGTLPPGSYSKFSQS